MHDISVNELSVLENTVLIDVRSPKEFQEGTIPSAFNVPLFDNEEREEIGKIYAKDSPKKAMERGLEIASGKLVSLYKEVETLAEKKSVVLFCWRGGMRSRSVALILELMGINVCRLEGGYKAYRRSVVDYFMSSFAFDTVVLRGNTGTGKTELLQKLKEEGYPVIDLEGLSNNRGSVFGTIGLGDQPSQKQFESMLYEEIMSYQGYPYLLLECESKRIGRVTVPNTIYDAMQKGLQIQIYDTLEHRARRVVVEYTKIKDTDKNQDRPNDIDHELRCSLERLKRRIGKDNIEELQKQLNQKDYEAFAKKLMTEYYDPLYGYPNQENGRYDYCIFNGDIDSAAKTLKDYLNDRYALG